MKRLFVLPFFSLRLQQNTLFDLAILPELPKLVQNSRVSQLQVPADFPQADMRVHSFLFHEAVLVKEPIHLL